MEVAFRDIEYRVKKPALPLSKRVARGFSALVASATGRKESRAPDEEDQRTQTSHDGDSKTVVILKSLSGSFPKGELIGIMGPSGSGKSSLTDILAGRRKQGTVTGDVYVDGFPRDATPGLSFKDVSAYVMQDDVFLGNLTVRETLLFSLLLRISRRSVTQEQQQQIIADILATLNLAKVADTRVGTASKRGISGGERRRLSIGVEMVTNPAVLFCDEITSGLDARNALRTMRAVRRLCKGGKHTVVCTIHQPRSSIFHMFDRLILLNDGQILYEGPGRMAALDYFSRQGLRCPRFENPADFLIDLIEFEESRTGKGKREGADAAVEEEEEDGADGESDAGAYLRDAEVDVQLVAVTRPRPESDATAAYGPGGGNGTAANGGGETGKARAALSALYLESPEYASLRARLDGLAALPTDRKYDRPPHIKVGDVGWWQEVTVLTRRQWTQTTRDSGVMYTRTFAALAIGLLVGLIFFQAKSAGNKINALLFLMCVFSLFCLPAITKLIEDRLLFQRERAAGYVTPSAYFISAMVVEIPVLVGVIIGYGIVSYWMVGLAGTIGNFLFFLLTITLVIFVTFSITQCAAAVVDSTNYAIALYMIILVYSLLLGGFMIGKKSLPGGLQWLVYTSYFYFGFSSLMVNEFDNGTVQGHNELASMDFLDEPKWRNVGILAGWLVGLRIAAYLLIKYGHKEKR